MAPLGSRAPASPPTASVTWMVAAESRLEEGRSEKPDPGSPRGRGTRNRDPRPNFFAGSPAGCTTRAAIQKIEEKREVTGPYESGAGPTRRERRARGKPALSEVRPGPLVLGLPGPAGTGQVALRGLPAARRVPRRRGRAERALGRLGRRDLRAWCRGPA